LAGLVLPALYVLALSGGSEASPRFRVIYTPLLCILTAVGLQAGLSGLRAIRKWLAVSRPLALEGRPPSA